MADFESYAALCFRSFGDRVKHWITHNEVGLNPVKLTPANDLHPMHGRCPQERLYRHVEGRVDTWSQSHPIARQGSVLLQAGLCRPQGNNRHHSGNCQSMQR